VYTTLGSYFGKDAAYYEKESYEKRHSTSYFFVKKKRLAIEVSWEKGNNDQLVERRITTAVTSVRFIMTVYLVLFLRNKRNYISVCRMIFFQGGIV